MIHWFFIALIGPLLYAFGNHTDKYFISKYLKGGKVGSLIIFSSFFCILALPVVIFFNPDVFNVSFLQAVILALNGMFIVLSLLLYFYALGYDDASSVVPFYQTIPIFAFINGYFFLGETITFVQGVASFIIILGALVLSIHFTDVSKRFKKEVMFLMLGASFLYAANRVVFKLIAVDEGFWSSTFWELIGKILFGLIFFAFVPVYRNHFLAMIKENNFTVIGLSSLSEATFLVAEGVMQYATLFAPVVLVLLVNSFQPIFVLAGGILLTLFLPHISQESLNRKVLIQKTFGIGLIVLGSYFIAA